MDPGELQRLLERANEAHASGDPQAAREALEAILSSHPSSVPARALYARLFPEAAADLPPAEAVSDRPWGFGEAGGEVPTAPAPPGTTAGDAVEDWGAAIDASFGSPPPERPSPPNATLLGFGPAEPPAAMVQPPPAEISEPIASPGEVAAPEPPAPPAELEPPAPLRSDETLLEFRAPPPPPPPPAEPLSPPDPEPAPSPAEPLSPPEPEPAPPPPEPRGAEAPPDPPAAIAPAPAPPRDETLLEFRVPPPPAPPPSEPPPPPVDTGTVGPGGAEPPAWHGDPWGPDEEAASETPPDPPTSEQSPGETGEARTPPAPALEMLSSDPPPAPTSPEASSGDIDRMLSGARELVALGDFSGALELLERVRAARPDDAAARELQERCERTLLQMWESKLGPVDRYPRVLLEPDEIVWLNLDHRAGFILAQIDGSVTYEDIFALSGMSRLDTCRILVQLLEQRVILSE